MTWDDWMLLSAVGVLVGRALGQVLWRTVELRRASRQHAWDYPPAPPPPIDVSEYSDAVDGLRAVSHIQRLESQVAGLRFQKAALEAENAALRSQLADARGDYR